jgi:ATP-dependent DNA helicase RecG
MSLPAPLAADGLRTPVQFMKYVGPQRAELLAKLGLRTAADVLFYFPRAYQDLSALRPIDQLEPGQLASVVGTIEEFDVRTTASGVTILGMLLRDGVHYLRCVWFNQPWIRGKFPIGSRVLVAGEVRGTPLRWEMVHPQIEILSNDEDAPAGRILPVYPLTEGIVQAQMRRIVLQAVETFGHLVEDVFPDDFLDTHRLWPIHKALVQIHQPADQASLDQARRRFIYQELLVLQLALAIRKWRLRHQRQAPPLPASAKIDARITRLFPFPLTAAQRQAIDEIASDMARPWPMNRLLQGEVGSGKTVVAMYAMLLAVAHGYQAALMAPTEILARQHLETLSRALAASRVRLALLVGSLTPAQRRTVLAQIAAGEVDIVIGTHVVTHAVARSGVEFRRLGLVVIDEQHKFGVRQRAALKKAGVDPHYLVMTATPIPRTVAMTLFGDLDVSELRELPPGRQKVHTYLASQEQRLRWWRFFRQKLDEGRQGYVITPLVEEAESVDAANVQATYDALRQGELAGYRLGMLHGRMTPAEKDAVMAAFRSGRLQVLVATSVVEVGVDVPNATLMTIEGGERFGLAQLHQLRGRISRGTTSGYLCVFTSSAHEESRRRLEAFCQTTDGFTLAEQDFRLRGPGDLFGTQQHGLPPLRIADLTRDAAVVEEARQEAQRLVATDPELAAPRWARLRRQVFSRYGAALDLGDVG